MKQLQKCATIMETLNTSLLGEAETSRVSLYSTLTSTSSASGNTQSSSSVWDTQTVVGDDEDEDEDEEQMLAERVQERKVFPRDVSDKLEPFEALPIVLSKFTESLVSFYLLQYPKQIYVFNQNLNPHPVYTNFAIAMSAPACFEVILARSALYRMSLGLYGTSLEKAELDTAVVEHKTVAIHRIRQLSAKKTPNKDEVIASIIALGTLDMRMGSTESADMHYYAVRRLLKEIGGPMSIKDLRLKRVMCFFECIYGTVRNSYIWDRSDFAGILERFNEYLTEIWKTWKERSITPELSSHSSFSQKGFPFPSTMPKGSPEAPKSGPPSTRKPTGPHSPYFGLQPMAKVVPKPRKSLVSKTHSPEESQKQSNDGFKDTRSTPQGLSNTVSRSRVSSSTVVNQSAKRQVTRPVAKDRLRRKDKQKEKQTAMKIDTQTPAVEIPKGEHHADAIPPSDPVPQPAIRKVSVSGKRTYWKLSAEAALHRRLSLWNELSEDKKKGALIWDLACLFCLTAIVVDHVDHDVKTLATYVSKLSKIVYDANLEISCKLL